MEKPNSSNALVCELINKGTREWNINNLNSWFLPEDREAILGIPLSSSNTPDRLVWAENRSGKFTDKSAYALALEEKVLNTRADCLDESARRILWKTIWQLKIPQKIKHFAWKAARDILATKYNLAKRKITPNGIRDLCGQNEETVIWKDRNDLRVGGKGKMGSMIVRNAIYLVEEFWLANEEKTEHHVEPVPLASWQPPSQGYYKVNTNGAVFSNRKQAGAGVVIKDGDGEVFAALSKKWKSPLSAIEAEAKALEAGVNFAREVGIRK
ncbi:uncharacterized protein LOC142624991 [Castanea sativa]|uniref:uncharacterized protein LOC142624991 n=1 Tax=Castanea sativa TaxID=21020 RepID=UPI003F654438